MTIDTNELRRLAQTATPGNWQFWHGWVAADIDNDGGVIIVERPTPSGGKYQARVDSNFKFIAAANPAAITELLDRLEAAENDAAHQKTLAESALRVAEGWERKCGELRAKIAEMEKQAPLDADSDVFRNSARHEPTDDPPPRHASHDAERIAKAEAKRARKAAKRAKQTEAKP